MSIVEKDPTLIHAPGIYFNLSEDEYHADTALGSTDIKLLATQPWVWQRNKLRPKARKVTDDMKWGTALHCRVLEGKEVFHERYAQKPRAEDLGKVGTEVLVTTDHLKSYLKKTRPALHSLGYKKDELIEIIKKFEERPIIFDDYLSEWRAKGRVSKELELDAVKVQEIEDAVFFLESDQMMSAVMETGALYGGSPELSIFYIENGIRRKARFDYALSPTQNTESAVIIDLKSFAQPRGENSEEAAKITLSQWDYDIQAIDYLNGYEKAKSFVGEGQIFGDEPFEGYLEQFFGAPSIMWLWVMVHKDGGFQPITMAFSRDHDGYHQDQHFQGAEAMCVDAITNLVEYQDKYGTDKLWPAPTQRPLLISGDMLPGYRKRT